MTKIVGIILKAHKTMQYLNLEPSASHKYHSGQLLIPVPPENVTMIEDKYCENVSKKGEGEGDLHTNPTCNDLNRGINS